MQTARSFQLLFASAVCFSAPSARSADSPSQFVAGLDTTIFVRTDQEATLRAISPMAANESFVFNYSPLLFDANSVLVKAFPHKLDEKQYWFLENRADASVFEGLQPFFDLAHTGPKWSSTVHADRTTGSFTVGGFFMVAPLSALSALGEISVNLRFEYATKPGIATSLQHFHTGHTRLTLYCGPGLETPHEFKAGLSTNNVLNRKNEIIEASEDHGGIDLDDVNWQKRSLQIVSDQFAASSCKSDLMVYWHTGDVSGFQFGEMKVQVLNPTN